MPHIFLCLITVQYIVFKYFLRYIIMFDVLDKVKKNIDNTVPQIELYINIMITILQCVLVYFMCLLLIGYNNSESNDKVFTYIRIISIVLLLMFYFKNMSRINLFMKTQWVSLDKRQKIFLFTIIGTLLVNIGIQYYRNHVFTNNSFDTIHIYILIILTGAILSFTVAKTIDSIVNLRDYVQNNKKNQVYHKLNKELSYAKLNEIKMYIEKPL